MVNTYTSVRKTLLASAFCLAFCLPAKADPICYMDMPDGSRLVLNGMCGREPVVPPKPGLTLENFRRLQINQTTYDQAVQILGGNGVLIGSSGGSTSSVQSVEIEIYEWNQNDVKIKLTFSKKFGRLVLDDKLQIGLQPDSKETSLKPI